MVRYIVDNSTWRLKYMATALFTTVAYLKFSWGFRNCKNDNPYSILHCIHILKNYHYFGYEQLVHGIQSSKAYEVQISHNFITSKDYEQFTVTCREQCFEFFIKYVATLVDATAA